MLSPSGYPNSLEEVDRYLEEDWIKPVLERHSLGVDVSVVAAAPNDSARVEKGVSLFLMSIESGFPQGPSRSVDLHYMVTTWAEDSYQAHQLLSELMFDALESPRQAFEAYFKPLPPAMWTAFKATPRPCFFIKYSLQRAFTETSPAGSVQEPLIIHIQNSEKTQNA